MLSAIRRSLLCPRQFGWLLALALLLPVAQWALAAHALQHVQGSVGDGHDPAGPLAAACHTCVVAAAIGGAAPLPATHNAPAPLQPRLQPQHRQAAAVSAAPALPYRSRAPPLPRA